MSVEACFAVNLIADAALLGAVSRALGIFNPRRLCRAAALCALYGVLAAACPMLSGAALQAVLLGVVAGLLSGGCSVRLCVVTGLSLAASALTGGGSRVLCPVSGPAAALPCAGAGALILGLLMTIRPPGTLTFQVTVGVSTEIGDAIFPALIDTGNRLREPLSGQPVLIAEAALLKRLLPTGGYRVLSYGAVGANGRMACFKPLGLWVERNGHRRAIEDAWVALAPGRLPGLVQALAPCEFALYI